MTLMGIEIVGHRILGRRLRAIGRLAEVTVRRAIVESAMRIEREAKASIRRNPRRGAAYVRHDPERRRRASAPGDAPATDTGALARKLTHVIDADGLGASVESRAAYSRFLEFGTARMAARPFLRPAFERQIGPSMKRIADALRIAIGQAAPAGAAD